MTPLLIALWTILLVPLSHLLWFVRQTKSIEVTSVDD